MDETAKDLSDLNGIARQIYAKQHPNGVASIRIGGFKFNCDIISAVVTRVPDQTGAVHSLPGKESFPAYEYEIRRALSVAAKMELLDRIRSLNDPKLNAVIDKHRVNPAYIQEQTVEFAVTKVFMSVKLPAVVRFGFTNPKQSERELAVYAASKNIGTDGVRTYADVETFMLQIPERLKTPAPAPSISPTK